MNISLRDKSISWKDFQSKFGKFFLISFEPKRLEAMAKKYTELTGRPAVDEVAKKPKNESSRPKGNSRKIESNYSGSDAKANTQEFKEQPGNSDQL